MLHLSCGSCYPFFYNNRDCGCPEQSAKKDNESGTMKAKRGLETQTSGVS